MPRDGTFAPRSAAGIAGRVVASKQNHVLCELRVVSPANFTNSTGLRVEHLVLHVVNLEGMHLDTLAADEARRSGGVRTATAQHYCRIAHFSVVGR